MIYLFIILFCLNASAVWSIALLLAERRARTIKHEISVHVEEGVQFWAPDDSAAATVMLTLDNEDTQ